MDQLLDYDKRHIKAIQILILVIRNVLKRFCKKM